jgi:glutamate--cysteine ligase
VSLTRPGAGRSEQAPAQCAPVGSPGPISEAEAQTYVHGICFKTGPPRRVGVELEWFVHDLGDPVLPVEPPRLAAALAPFMTAPPTTAPPDTGNGSRSSPSSAVPSGTPPVGPPGTPPDGLVDTPLHGGRLPAGALLSREPGGQVELSSLPAENLSECVDSVRRIRSRPVATTAPYARPAPVRGHGGVLRP